MNSKSVSQSVIESCDEKNILGQYVVFIFGQSASQSINQTHQLDVKAYKMNVNAHYTSQSVSHSNIYSVHHVINSVYTCHIDIVLTLTILHLNNYNINMVLRFQWRPYRKLRRVEPNVWPSHQSRPRQKRTGLESNGRVGYFRFAKNRQRIDAKREQEFRL